MGRQQEGGKGAEVGAVEACNPSPLGTFQDAGQGKQLEESQLKRAGSNAVVP